MNDESNVCGDEDANENSSDGMPSFSKWSLTFKDHELERAYQETQRRDLRWTALIGFSIAFLIFLYTPLALVADKGQWPDAGPLRLVMDFNAGAALYSLGLVVVLGLHRDRIGYRSIEALVVIGTALFSVGSVFTDFYRAALVFGEDPETYWDREHFSDSGVLLTIDLIITATHLFCPIRSCVSWTIPLSGVLCYTLLSYLLGTRDKFILEFIFIQLGALAIFSWYGRRRSEKESRLGFARQRALADTVKTKEKEVIAEKIMRFDAEHEIERTGPTTNTSSSESASASRGGDRGLDLDQSNSSGAGRANAHSGVPNLDASLRSGGSGHNAHSGVLNLDTSALSGGSGRSDTLSLSLTNLTDPSHPGGPALEGITEEGTRAVVHLDKGTDPMPIDRADKALDPLLVWSETGWKCQRCSRPPVAPETDRQGNFRSATSSSTGSSRRRKRGDKRPDPLEGANDDMSSPQLSTFKLTPHKTRRVQVLDMLQTWNCSRGGADSCCPFHKAVRDAKVECECLIRAMDCDPLWMPFSARQCLFCFSMQAGAEEPECDFCGQLVDSATTSPVVDSDDSDLDDPQEQIPGAARGGRSRVSL